MVTCHIKALNVVYGNLFSNQRAFTMLETEIFKYNFLQFYVAENILCIMLKFVPLTIQIVIS